MARLRAEFQRMGMSANQAVEAADLLLHVVQKSERLVADAAPARRTSGVIPADVSRAGTCR